MTTFFIHLNGVSTGVYYIGLNDAMDGFLSQTKQDGIIDMMTSLKDDEDKHIWSTINVMDSTDETWRLYFFRAVKIMGYSVSIL